jgi:polar amino acid transport system substrate-binding protein
MKRSLLVASLLAVLVLMLAACTPGAPPQAPAAPAAPAAEEAAPAAAQDLLQVVMDRGVLRIATDPAYPPQSELVADATRPADTKCSSNERTANEFAGFDIDVAVEIANRLGLEPCFVTPDWTLITGGSWADRWDLSIGSMTITPERMRALYFTQPYYTTPAQFFVHESNTSFTKPEDLSGKRIGVCAGCTYEFYLDHSLSIPGETIDFLVSDADVVGYDTDTSALQDLALGDGVRLDAVLTALPTGMEAINNGMPMKPLGDPVFFEYLAGAVDKHFSVDPIPFVKKVTEVINEMHADGTLKELSMKYYNADLASAAADFDWEALDQFK